MNVCDRCEERCDRLRYALQMKVQGMVRQAVVKGNLPPLSKCKCVDCGAPARDYDHRDYRKPLDVVPVCRSCNRKRGAGIYPDTKTLIKMIGPQRFASANSLCRLRAA